ncbi:hypothetical protein [Pseudomonas sp. S2_C03]
MTSSNHTVTCPHCMNEVPWGAHVCRGCQAEVRYGTPQGVVVFFLILCVIAGWWGAKVVRTFVTTNPTLLWIVFGIVFLLCGLASRKICKRFYDGKTVFRRFYRK